jgi:hypothetical protein
VFRLVKGGWRSDSFIACSTRWQYMYSIVNYWGRKGVCLLVATRAQEYGAYDKHHDEA